MKVFITRYALTKGIIEQEAECSGKCISYSTSGYTSYVYKPDWHETETEARAHADQMRLKKIASLKKQIAKLEKLSFMSEWEDE